jgi:succinate dehydrogenase / fumarate reductase iron-sulfur subunit
MDITFKLWRQQPGHAPRFQDYVLDVATGDTVLDALLRLQGEQDGTIAFRKNCRNTICGSCAMRINGRSTLACKENCFQEIHRLKEHGILQTDGSEASRPVITVAPLGNLKVVKDLVVDMKPFWDGLKAIDPYVSTASRKVPEREFLQTPEERAKLDQTGNCILCGACYSDCNALEINPQFVGPHALAKAYRTLADSRDDRTIERIEQYNQGVNGVWGCTRCYYCNSSCPMEVAPLDQISKVKSFILKRKTKHDSRAIRHRKVLLELVKSGGWVDERKFGIEVVSNSFQDLQGLLSLIPLGLRMVASRKFPVSFEPSEGQAEVRSLITAVQSQQTSKPDSAAQKDHQ